MRYLQPPAVAMAAAATLLLGSCAGSDVQDAASQTTIDVTTTTGESAAIEMPPSDSVTSSTDSVTSSTDATTAPTTDSAAVEATPGYYLSLPTIISLSATAEASTGEVRLLRTGVGSVLNALVMSDSPQSAAQFDVVRTPNAGADAVETVDVGGTEIASAIRMGALTVPLDSHLVVDYGERAGLLELVPTGVVNLSADLVDDDAFTASCTAGDSEAIDPASTTVPAPPPGPPGATLPPRDPSDKTIYGWFMGMPVVPNITLPSFYGGTGPDAPSPDVPDLHVYLTGPVDESAPLAPAREIPTASGMKALPPHQDTVASLPGPEEPHDAMGYFVVRGPNGSESNVRVRPDPPNSIPGAPMAYQMLVGDRWTPLNNHIVIEYGLATGALELRPFEFGGLMWTPFPDEVQMTVECEPTGVELSEVGRVTAGTIDIQNEDGLENTPVDPEAAQISLDAHSFEFEPARIVADAGTPLAITLTSHDVVHDLVIENLDGYVLADASQSGTGGFAAPTPGTYRFYCSIGGHREAGMEGLLVVE